MRLRRLSSAALLPRPHCAAIAVGLAVERLLSSAALLPRPHCARSAGASGVLAFCLSSAALLPRPHCASCMITSSERKKNLSSAALLPRPHCASPASRAGLPRRRLSSAALLPRPHCVNEIDVVHNVLNTRTSLPRLCCRGLIACRESVADLGRARPLFRGFVAAASLPAPPRHSLAFAPSSLPRLCCRGLIAAICKLEFATGERRSLPRLCCRGLIAVDPFWWWLCALIALLSSAALLPRPHCPRPFRLTADQHRARSLPRLCCRGLIATFLTHQFIIRLTLSSAALLPRPHCRRKLSGGGRQTP